MKPEMLALTQISPVAWLGQIGISENAITINNSYLKSQIVDILLTALHQG
jgi:hypothetical protein